MPLDEERFPERIRELYKLVAQLEALSPGRPFTPDGHMVGSLAECAAFDKRTGRIIKLLTVREILDEGHVQKV